MTKTNFQLSMTDADKAVNKKNQIVMLMAFANNGQHVYQGTVTAKVKATRRAKNKVAKASRRLNRGA
jgi:hypothetical protein